MNIKAPFQSPENRKMPSAPLWVVPLLVLSLSSGSLPAATLTAYYTLDNLSTGVQNQGSAGNTAANTLSNVGAGSTLPTTTTGFIGGGVFFNGTTSSSSLGTTAAGNAGDDISAYPFSMSVWILASDNGFAMSLSAHNSSDRYFGVGVANNEAIVTRRNTTALTSDSNTVVTGAWHQVVASYNGAQDTQIYVDGKLVLTDTTTNVSMLNPSAFVLGGILRSSTQLISQFTGTIDDAGLFTGSLTGNEVALVNGLGRTASLGLDWLDDAYSLSLASVGTTATLGGFTWERVTGLTGVMGDYGGTASGGNAFVVTDNSGNGIQVQMVPEPGACMLLTVGLMALFLRRRR